ncbi:MAG: hypothetical protein L3J49_14370 [Desulfobulbaceae bacterium]|nr:hypothetical protein [Desulfobulbaceae bacterium]
MRIHFLPFLIILTVSGLSLAFVQTASTEQLSEAARKWDQKIIRNSPSRVEQQHLPSQKDVENAVLLARDADYRMLQEKHRLWLLIAIVVSTPILLIIILFCMKKAPDCSGESLVNAVGLVLVIEGTMFIAVSAVTTEQLTAPIGILGAIAGYLFGSAKRKATEGA